MIELWRDQQYVWCAHMCGGFKRTYNRRPAYRMLFRIVRRPIEVQKGDKDANWYISWFYKNSEHNIACDFEFPEKENDYFTFRGSKFVGKGRSKSLVRHDDLVHHWMDMFGGGNWVQISRIGIDSGNHVPLLSGKFCKILRPMLMEEMLYGNVLWSNSPQ